MYDRIRISPSLLSCDFMHMGDEVASCERNGADWLHVDVMDGHFVPNLTIGVPIQAQLAQITTMPLDVHLMISNPIMQLPWYLQHKPAVVTVHWEAFDPAAPNDDAWACIALMREAGVMSGIALKPDTPTSVLRETITAWDMILVMSVFPGFSGQSFIPETPGRVREVVQMAREAGVNPLIQVDGGINDKTAPLVAAEGADVLVAGNGFFKAPDRAHAAATIRAAAESAQTEQLTEGASA